MAKKERYYEGTTSANSIVKDIAKVLCTGVQDDAIFDANGELLKDRQLIKERNFDIVYPKANLDKLVGSDGSSVSIQDKGNLTADEQLAKISQQLRFLDVESHNRIILKTKTTPVDVEQQTGDTLGLENDLNKDSIEMYVELYKPEYLIDLEKYHPETEIDGIQPSVTTIEGYKESIATSDDKTINIYEKYFNETGEKNVLVEEPEHATESEKIYKNTDDRDTFLGSDSGYATAWKALENAYSSTVVSDTTIPVKYEINVKWGEINDPNKKDAITKMLNAINVRVPSNNKDIIHIVLEAKYTTYANNSTYHKITVNADRYQQKFSIKKYDPVSSKGFRIKLDKQPMGDVEITYSGGELNDKFEVVSENSGDSTDYYLQAKEDLPKEDDENNTFFDGLSSPPIINYTYAKTPSSLMSTTLVKNYHNLFIRVYDKLNAEGDGPEEPIYDDNGEIIEMKAHISEWSKLSWYKDFEELAIDTLDEDPSTSDISEGVKNLPTVTPGLNGNTRIQFWVNTSNDTVSLVVMGNPSLEFGSDKHISSFAYIGRVKSFDNSINDTAGNFALATSSTSVPCSTKITKKIKSEERIIDRTEEMGYINEDGDLGPYTLSVSSEEFNYEMTPKVIAYPTLEDAENKTNAIELGIEDYKLELPKDLGINKVDVTFLSGAEYTPLSGTYLGLKYSTNKQIIETFIGAVRDDLGNMIQINLPETYGINTATGVTDISMLHTRSKAYYQKHHLMFTTTNEYMKKELYGKSAYTSEYYADRAKITHGNDGPRGMLKNILIIDTSSLVALDELVINRDHKKNPDEPEETFIYFPITAPYSPLTSGPNSMYGIAIKKNEVLPAPETDEEAVSRAVEDLYINDLHMVTDDIYLPNKGIEDTTIAWESSNPSNLSIILTDENVTLGEVTREIFSLTENNDVELKLTATVSKGEATATKEFTAIIKEDGMTDSEAVSEDLNSIVLPTQTSENLVLPVEGANNTTITWESGNESVLATDGTITRPANPIDPEVDPDEIVSLTATVSRNGVSSDPKEFNVKVLAWTDIEELQLDHQFLDENGFNILAGENPSKERVTSNLDLPDVLDLGSTVTWTSSDTQIIDTTTTPGTGIVTRPAYNSVPIDSDGKTVNLTAELLAKDGFSTKTYQEIGIVVLKLDMTDEENIHNGTVGMTFDDIVTPNDGLLNLTQNFELPSKPKPTVDSTVQYRWKVSDADGNEMSIPEISIASSATDNDNDGVDQFAVTITRPDTNNVDAYIKRITTSAIDTPVQQEDIFPIRIIASS